MPQSPGSDLADGAAPGARWTAIVLAGERPGDPFAAAMGVPAKALIAVAGEMMIARVVRALIAVPEIARVVILTQVPETLAAALPRWLVQAPQVVFATSSDTISTSIHRAIDDGTATLPVLVTTADHPLLTPAILAEFLAAGDTSDLAIGLVARRTLIASYPGSRRTWLRFADGDFTGANLFALRGRAALAAVRFWARAERDRKRRFKLFRHFGPCLFVRAVTRTIGLRSALARAGEAIGAKVEPVVIGIAEAGIDVDKVADLLLAESILAVGEERLNDHAEPGPAARVAAGAIDAA